MQRELTKDAMEKENRSGRQPLFPKDREYLRLRAGPQLLELGRVPGTADPVFRGCSFTHDNCSTG